MSSSAKFGITGTVSGHTAFSAAGHDAVLGETLTLALEDLPALDVASIQYEVVSKTKSAPVVAFSAGGAPLPPTTPVTWVVPVAGTHTFHFRCTVRGGMNALGVQYIDVRERVVTVRSPRLGLR